MAFNNTGGHWLQKDKNVNNPYFGAQMLRCGTIKKSVGVVK
jgi:Cu(I)/Ag(I) efflux system membrane fusion protein